MSVTPQNRHHKYEPSKKNGISCSAISPRITFTESGEVGLLSWLLSCLPCELIELWSDVDYGGSPGKTCVNIRATSSKLPSLNHSLH